jgi:hypothetical protein
MAKTKKMDGQPINNIRPFAGYRDAKSPQMVDMYDETEKNDQPSWLFRRLVDQGLIDMAGQQKPAGWHINPTNLTTLITILGFIGGLFWFTWTTAYKQGHFEAERQAEIVASEKEKKTLIERLEKAEADAKKAKELSTYGAGLADSHGAKEKK